MFKKLKMKKVAPPEAINAKKDGPYLLCEWLDEVVGVGDSLTNDGCPDSGNHKCNVLVFVVG